MSSNHLPYFRMHPKDFDTDENVRLMSMCAKGLYIICLNHSWVNGSLPNDIKKIAKIANEPVRIVKKVWLEVSKCFTENADGQLVNPRLEAEREMVQEKRSKCREASDLRWNNNTTEPPYEEVILDVSEELLQDADALPRASESDSVSSSFEVNSEALTRARGPKMSFEDFIPRWRRHLGFKKPPKPVLERARVGWRQVSIDSEQLDRALDGYHDSDWAKKEGYPILGFTKDPCSWIADSEPIEEMQLISTLSALQQLDSMAEWNRMTGENLSLGRFSSAEQKAIRDGERGIPEEKRLPVLERATKLKQAGCEFVNYKWLLTKGWPGVDRGDYDWALNKGKKEFKSSIQQFKENRQKEREAKNAGSN